MTTVSPREPRVAGREDEVFVGGAWTPTRTGATRPVISPHSEEVIATLADPGPEEALAAAEAARRAFDEGPWTSMSPARRADVVVKIGEALRGRADDLAMAFSLEAGVPISKSGLLVSRSIDYWQRAADIGRYFNWEEVRGWSRGEGYARVQRVPAGVGVGILTSNGPLATAGNKAAYALVAGCTMILKAAPESALTMQIFAEAVQTVESLPPGVLNVLAGGTEVGQQLVSSPLVDIVSLTGGTAAGKWVLRALSDRIGRAILELGGKSVGLVTEHVELDSIIDQLMWNAMQHCGQVCTANTRALVPQAMLDDTVAKLESRIGQIGLGAPLDPSTEQGPMITSDYRSRVSSIVDSAVAAGAELVAGGRSPKDLLTGWYYEPTLLVANNDSPASRHEIFGPVLTVIPYQDTDEAVRIANDSAYGLAGTVYCDDVALADSIADRLRTGQVYINAPGTVSEQPMGGFKQSGLGREGGPEGLEAWTETRVIFR